MITAVFASSSIAFRPNGSSRTRPGNQVVRLAYAPVRLPSGSDAISRGSRQARIRHQPAAEASQTTCCRPISPQRSIETYRRMTGSPCRRWTAEMVLVRPPATGSIAVISDSRCCLSPGAYLRSGFTRAG